MSESKKGKRPEISDLFGIVKDFHRFSLPPDSEPLHINNLLEHCVSQLRIAKLSGDERKEWNLLESHILNVVKFTKERNRDSAINEGIALCLLAGRLSAVPDEILESLMLDHESRKKSNKPLDSKLEQQKILKSAAQTFAQIYWSTDTSKTIRIGMMCEHVYSKLHAMFKDSPLFQFLPDQPLGLKPWLRPVAPDYAKKGGRPHK